MDNRLGVALACLVVTAGCNALSPGAADWEFTETVTPAPVPESGSPTPSTDSLPPGLYANGTVDPDRLRAAHTASVEGVSYTWLYTRASGEGSNVTRRFERRVTVDEDAILVRDVNRDSLPNRSLYLTDEEGYLRQEGDEPSRVDPAGPETHHEQAPVGRLIGAFLPDRDATVSVLERDGQRFYRLYVPQGWPPPRLRSDAGEGWTVVNYRVTLYVTPEGHVRTASVEYDRKLAAGETERVTVRFDYTGVGETTVARPDWVPVENETASPTSTPTPTSTPERG